jgi:chemotaxis protein methyltransferase WspC
MDAIVHNLRRTIGLDSASIGFGAIERAVHQRMDATNISILDQYRVFLEGSSDELRALIEILVVPETWFFRDRGAFDAVAAEAKAPKHTSQLRFLCVPCASGEEPLSLAMTLLDAGIPAERFHIDACDISDRLVAHARRGIYGRNSFRGNSGDIRSRYFEEAAGRWAIDPAVRDQVTFRQANLLDASAFPGVQMYDAVFCRNLLIYFDPEAQQKAIGVLSNLMPADGLLCVAPAETGLLLRHGLVPSDASGAFAFWNRKRTRPQKLPVVAKRVEPRAISAPIAPKAPQKPRPLSLPAPAEPKAKEAAAPPDFAEAIRLADEGRFSEVSRICQAHIEAHGPSADAYYLLALVSDASARYEEAATLYRKALYLDPQHRDALAHFSLLAGRLGETATAGALRQRAIRIESSAA